MSTLIFDIGKTNKKWFIFNQYFEVIAQDSIIFSQVEDEDGYPCENLDALSEWIINTSNELISDEKLNITKINFSAYGATIVHLDEFDQVCTPLYNYLKKPDSVNENSFKEYLAKYPEIEVQTGAAIAGMLNTGFQLFWLKTQKPHQFKKIKKTLHLPQYFSFLFTGKAISELTSLGCHTTLWDFNKHELHHWLSDKNVLALMPPFNLKNSFTEILIQNKKVLIGNGIHDSSAALLPYKTGITSPFILLSSGTWSIFLNPFDQQEITQNDIDQELIYYLQPDGKKVRATRLYYGKIYEDEVAKIHISEEEITQIPDDLITDIIEDKSSISGQFTLNTKQKDYLTFIYQVANAHVQSLNLAKGKSEIEGVYIDGGFAKNEFFLKFLSAMLYPIQVYKAENPIGSALGAAVIMDTTTFTSNIFRKRYNLNQVLRPIQTK